MASRARTVPTSAPTRPRFPCAPPLRRLHVTPAGVAAVAREARAKNVGARGLRSILENLLLDAMFHVRRAGQGCALLWLYTAAAAQGRPRTRAPAPPTRALRSPSASPPTYPPTAGC